MINLNPAVRLVPSNCQGLFPIDLKHRAHTNEVLGSFAGAPDGLVGGKGQRNERFGFGQRQRADRIGNKVKGRWRLGAFRR